MTSRRVHLWVWWLLPLLVARALMPVGFMAQTQHGKLQIVWCSAGASQLLADVYAADGAADSDHDTVDGDLDCPFAHVATALLPDLGSSEPIPFFATAEILPSAESPYYAVGPPRFIATRGPPSHS